MPSILHLEELPIAVLVPLVLIGGPVLAIALNVLRQLVSGEDSVVVAARAS